MERQIMASRKVQRKEKKKEEYLPRKQVSDESELEKSCLTEEQDARLSDASHNSNKRIRELDTNCESKKRKKHKPSKESPYKTLFDDDFRLFGNNQQKNVTYNKAAIKNGEKWLSGNNKQKNVTNNKAAIKNDDEDMIRKLLQRSSGDCLFHRAQFLCQVGIFALPYTVPL